MKVNVSNAFHILFCLKTEYLRFSAWAYLAAMFEPAEYIRYATKWLKEHEIYQTHKKTWNTGTFNASIKKNEK